MRSEKGMRPHISVMNEEFLHFFEGKDLSIFFEGTLGAGGHAFSLLTAHPEIRTYIGCDLDRDALQLARKYLAPWEKKIMFIEGNFSHLDEYLDERGIKEVDGFFLT